MNRAWLLALVLALSAAWAAPAAAVDSSKVKAATDRVESGAKKIGAGKVGEGVEDTAKGIGRTMVEGAKYSGEKVKDAGKATERQAETTWGHVRDGAKSLGQSVKTFFTRLFSN